MTQLPFDAFLPQTDWRPTPVSQLPSWAGAKRVSFDIEACDPQLKKLGIGVRRDGYMVGYSFSIEDGPSHYVPFRHEGGDNLDEAQALAYLRDQAASFEGILTGGNLGYDLDYAAHNKAVFRKVKQVRCIQVAEPLINEHRLRYGNDALADIYSVPRKKEDLLRQAASIYKVDPKAGLYKLPARFVGEYAQWDAEMCHRILRKQERIIDDEDMWQIFDLECRITPILVKMRRRGVKIDLDRLAQVTNYLLVQEQKMCDEINLLSSVKISPSDLKKESRLGPFLRSNGFEPEKTATGKDSITKDWLDSLDSPVAKKLNEARAFATMVSFAEGLPRYITPEGRVHPTFNQLKTDKDGERGTSHSKQKKTKGAISGRMSSTDPNAQQQPVRMGALWRAIYRPDYGQWFSSDYSQQEPRLTVHYAEITGCMGAAEAAQRYRDNPAEDNHDMMAELTGLPRKQAKAVFLGKCYNMGEAKFCEQLGLPTAIGETRSGRKILVAGPEGKAILEQFDRAVPFVKQLNDKVEGKARRRGEIRTLLNRVIHFPVDEYGNYDWTHKALNRLIQGGAADQMKKAMVDADAAGIRLQLQVHDEVDFSAHSVDEAEKLAEIMRNAVPLRVPSKVDLESGPSWGEIDEKGRAQCARFYK